jgi:hypothetical protein
LRENVNGGLRSDGGCLGRLNVLERPQALLQEFKVLQHLFELLFGGRGIASPAPLNDKGVGQGPNNHDEHEDEASIVHRQENPATPFAAAL